ncbi:MAG: type II secretion system F family protein [Thermoguttaceae bacterium]
MSGLLLGMIAFFGVATLVGGAALLMGGKGATRAENRLDLLTGAAPPQGGRSSTLKEGSLLARPLDDAAGFLHTLLERFGNVELLFEQADVSLSVGKLVAISAILAVSGAGMMAVVRAHPALIPLPALVLGALPPTWVLHRRRKRLKAFAGQLPDALEMLGRALRSGQSLAFGFNAVAVEMPAPISKEFNRVFEEQNLGIPLDESLKMLCDRVPNLDLKFFTTAVILQRQTGGDLAEILDKISSLIRDRFRIWGQVQALTGEGRMSGVVLMGLPLVLLLAVYELNPKYVSVLFTDPAGKKMLAIAVAMQVLGALVIRKIVNIKV